MVINPIQTYINSLCETNEEFKTWYRSTEVQNQISHKSEPKFALLQKKVNELIKANDSTSDPALEARNELVRICNIFLCYAGEGFIELNPGYAVFLKAHVNEYSYDNGTNDATQVTTDTEKLTQSQAVALFIMVALGPKVKQDVPNALKFLNYIIATKKLSTHQIRYALNLIFPNNQQRQLSILGQMLDAAISEQLLPNENLAITPFKEQIKKLDPLQPQALLQLFQGIDEDKLQDCFNRIAPTQWQLFKDLRNSLSEQDKNIITLQVIPQTNTRRTTVLDFKLFDRNDTESPLEIAADNLYLKYFKKFVSATANILATEESLPHGLGQIEDNTKRAAFTVGACQVITESPLACDSPQLSIKTAGKIETNDDYATIAVNTMLNLFAQITNHNDLITITTENTNDEKLLLALVIIAEVYGRPWEVQNIDGNNISINRDDSNWEKLETEILAVTKLFNRNDQLENISSENNSKTSIKDLATAFKESVLNKAGKEETMPNGPGSDQNFSMRL